jgi:hypothetical protein
MHKKWLFSGLVTVFLAANLLYWLPVLADPSTCPAGFKCFFNDSGNILLQSSTSTNGYVYVNYINSNAYGLSVSPTGRLYQDGNPLVVANGATYNISISGSSYNIKAMNQDLTPNDVTPDSQSFIVSSEASYWNPSPALSSVDGLSSIYRYQSKNTGASIVSQLAFVQGSNAAHDVSQYLQFRFNSSTNPTVWNSWREVCDSSNNCQNFINFLDSTANGALMMYQDPDLLMESGLKISDPNALSDCGSLNTVGGVIGCGAAGTGGGVDGSGTANYITKWSNTSTIGSSLIYDNGTNVGVGTTSPQGKLAVAGTGYFTGAVRVGTPITSSDAVDRNYVDSAISALGGGEAVTFAGVSATTFTGNQGGYDNANSLCAAVDSASHICTTEDILAIINNGNASTIPTTTTGYWISNGPPGYTVNANDCSGYNSNSDNDFGTVWIKVDNSHYFGALQPCGQAVKFACCK